MLERTLATWALPLPADLIPLRRGPTRGVDHLLLELVGGRCGTLTRCGGVRFQLVLLASSGSLELARRFLCLIGQRVEFLAQAVVSHLMLLDRRSAPISTACVQSKRVTTEPDPVVPK